MFFYNPIGFKTLISREISRFMKVYIQTLLAPLLSNMLFLGVFGGMMRTRQIGIEGVDYLSFLVPGLCVMGAFMNAYQNPSSSIMIQKYQNIIQDLNSYPMSIFEKVLAFIVGGTFRGVLVGVLTYIATIFFVGYHINSPLLFFFMLIVVSWIASCFGVVTGLAVKTFDQGTFILTIILTPLTYFGGVFFEVTKLPGILGKLALFNPIFPLVDLARYGYIGILEGNMIMNIIYVLILALISLFFAYWLFSKGTGLKD